jgi:CopG family nickel-responsive transcriptional regulator
MEEYKRFTVSLPQDLYDKFEEFRNKIGISRSDSIRKSMQLFLIQEENISEVSENVVGCITIMMSHEHVDITTEHSHEHLNGSDHNHDYSSRPIYANVQQTDEILKNDIQHHFHDIIISTMHVHLEYKKCLEIIAVSGPYQDVKKLKDSLQRLKSVLSLGFFIVDKDSP